MFEKDKWILIGKVTGTHGIRGQLRIASFSGEPESIIPHRTLYFQRPAEELESFEVAGSSVHGKKVLVSLKSLDDINKLEFLVGSDIYVERKQLPDLADGEYYWCDLIGLKVFTVKGEYIGEVSDIMATGSNDIYVVRNEGKEFLIPAIEDVVVKIDLDESEVIIDPPEGLLDL
jgi:16S rRNA processing protein RimM